MKLDCFSKPRIQERPLGGNDTEPEPKDRGGGIQDQGDD